MSIIPVNPTQSILFERRCKICQMANSSPDIFKDLHINVLEVGMSLNRAMNLVNDRIRNECPEIALLNNQNLGVHFGSHITLPERVAHEIATATSSTPPSLKEINPEVGTFIQDIIQKKIGNEVNDYLNLDNLRMRALEKLELLDGIIEKTSSNGDKIVDLDAMTHFTGLLKEIRSCVVDLNKVRNSRQLISMIIKNLIEKTTFETVRKLSREYDQVKKDLIDKGVGQDIVISMDQQLRINLAEIVSEVARSAIQDILRMYKLS
jgi:hypothetical protein